MEYFWALRVQRFVADSGVQTFEKFEKSNHTLGLQHLQRYPLLNPFRHNRPP